MFTEKGVQIEVTGYFNMKVCLNLNMSKYISVFAKQVKSVKIGQFTLNHVEPILCTQGDYTNL